MAAPSSPRPVSLHSDEAPRQPCPTAPVPSLAPESIPSGPSPDSARYFQSPPSRHRRVNTEYIPRAPLFEQGLDASREDQSAHSPFPPLSWTDTLNKRKARVLSDWFQGKSESVDLGNSKLRAEGITPDRTTTMDATRLTPSSTLSRKKSVSPTRRFSFFGLRRQSEVKPGLPAPVDDEFLNLDIDEALAPDTNPASSEAALDSLRDQADSVIRRMQEAYKQRTLALHQGLIDKNEKQDELVESRALVEHLRVQLDGMASKALEQEKAMQAMAEELEEERLLRQQQDQQQDATPSTTRTRTQSTDDDIPSIALQTPQRGGKRASHGTFTSDSGFESGDNESVADSIFSQREGIDSPPSTLVAPSPNMSQIALPIPKPVTSAAAPAPAPAPSPTPAPTRASAYDRVKGFASTRLGNLSGYSSQCGICHGVPVSEAWSVMGVLKDENRGLKMRLGELELVIDDCLSMVGP
ncbi:hypothetical protein N7474_001815 [Penicillium riverlandense]|uniref:uncharacterized protein n=1 Tax=Penicillium riverlandense TaxID=1903569 RepID=UPI002548D376|nr:uncharacterized protein N7474_001815 [Penicillium riverlandense]KAJ5833504.1 hypothetical protein N7474_001815 [Penicillium riverlandense]